MPLDMDKERLDLSMNEFLEQMRMAVDNGKIVGGIAERELIADWLQEILHHPSKPSNKWIVDKIRAGINAEA